jgi:predicted metal-dependent hydrolase
VLTVPHRLGRGAVDAFLEAHRGWLASRLAVRPLPMPFCDGALVPLRGVEHRIVHDPAMRGAVVKVEARAAASDGGGAGGLAPRLVVSGGEAHLARRLRDWLAAEAKRDLKTAVDRHAAAVGAKPRALKVRDTVSRWGSCSVDGVLSFSWRLVLAPPPVLDYLAAHEVAHLVRMDHSPAFWAVVARLFPDHRSARAWLKREGGRLHAIGAESGQIS